MRIWINKRRFIPLFNWLLIASFTLFGVAQFYRNTSGGRVSLLAAETKRCSKTAVVLDRIIKGVFSADVLKKLPLTQSSSEKSKKNKLSRFIFYILGTMLVSGEKSILLLMIAFIGALLLRHKKQLFEWEKKIRVPPEFKFYIWWSLRFLSPVQKCIQTLTDKYDINPIFTYGVISTRVINPHFVISKQSAGFFVI